MCPLGRGHVWLHELDLNELGSGLQDNVQYQISMLYDLWSLFRVFISKI